MGEWIFIIIIVGFFVRQAYVAMYVDHMLDKEKERERERRLKNLPELTPMQREETVRRDEREAHRWALLIAPLVLVVSFLGASCSSRLPLR
jgi:hypothetical protein